MWGRDRSVILWLAHINLKGRKKKWMCTVDRRGQKPAEGRRVSSSNHTSSHSISAARSQLQVKGMNNLAAKILLENRARKLSSCKIICVLFQANKIILVFIYLWETMPGPIGHQRKLKVAGLVCGFKRSSQEAVVVCEEDSLGFHLGICLSGILHYRPSRSLILGINTFQVVTFEA